MGSAVCKISREAVQTGFARAAACLLSNKDEIIRRSLKPNAASAVRRQHGQGNRFEL